MTFQVTTMLERPDLREAAEMLIADNWPRFLQQDQMGVQYWAQLYEQFPAFQIFLLQPLDGTLVAVGNCIPLAWDEADDDLPNEGWRWVLAQGFQDKAAGLSSRNLAALSITLHPQFLGQGVSSLLVKAMKEIGRNHALKRLIAPVRPNLKHRYPLIPMKDYVTWQQEISDLPFDAWLRVHKRLGARIVKICPSSMRIVGTVADWEAWTQLSLRQSGLYLTDGCLVPFKVSLEQDLGVYIEPNVWMIYPDIRPTLPAHVT